MRILLMTVMLVLSLWSTGESRPPQHAGAAYQGTIVFKDGTHTTFTWLWSRLAGDKLPFIKDLTAIPATTADWPKLPLARLARLDFAELTPAEQRFLRSTRRPTIRKATVTFRDGTESDVLYLDLALLQWRGAQHSGHFRNDTQLQSLTIEPLRKKHARSGTQPQRAARLQSLRSCETMHTEEIGAGDAVLGVTSPIANIEPPGYGAARPTWPPPSPPFPGYSTCFCFLPRS